MNPNDKKARLSYLVETIKNSPALPEEALEGYMEELERISPDPEVSDYIFWRDWTVEEIVDQVLAYRAIEL